MKEKELRLAVVFFGGVSLAIYQHGINREILNLARASKIYHADKPYEGQGKPVSSLHERYPDEPEQSTGDVYREFLETLGKDVCLRVIVDVIAGSSAGGINGVTLATALAHDRSLMPITDMWLDDADMLSLLAPEAKAHLWNKWYFWPLVHPLLTRLNREGLLPGKANAEMEKRISVFLRSRWFKPPLDGRRLSTLMLDGLTAMKTSSSPWESLLPQGARLDLLVTVTDFRGIEQPIFIHDPAVAYEREHRHLLRFSLDHRRTGHLLSDFDIDNFPSLAFAGRATASYPGAFPPARIREIDELLAERHMPWPARAHFLDRNFRHYRERGENPEEAILLDGSVLDNKPITACVEAIRTHCAFREVDRRLVFIDPHPGIGRAVPGSGVPGFFATLRGALSDLPRHDPVYNELAVISRYNVQARRLKAAILNARPIVAKLIAQATEGRLRGDFTADDLRHWRLSSISLLSSTTIVYDVWMRSLVLEALDFIVRIIVSACQYTANSPEACQVQEVIEAWARQQGVIADSYAMPDNLYRNVDLPPFGKIILDFGVIYKRRRLNFVLHEINDLYPGVSSEQAGVADSESLDLLKIKIHKCIDELSIFDDIDFLSRQAVAGCREIFLEQGDDTTWPAPATFEEISRLVERLAQECDLARTADNADAVLASSLVLSLEERSRDAILTGYLGYFFWDIILRPTMSALSLDADAGPIEEILVDRISPEDASGIVLDEQKNVLLGRSFASFGGFLDRSIRENDYLWGRLHAVDRLFDILLSTVPVSIRDNFAIDTLKKRAFERVLEEERQRLTSVPALIARIKAAIEHL
ncbi:patatin-like protein [Azotobacter beijerinckii]|uniref:Patatin-related protein n=1 Tax=Azotobacter beijerinckii TaxID=170623 RepID=A0A1I3ZHI2_9GAMM|nr:patatin-like protein [Azotobacter beijerinckii]SFB14440.1 patatin-related protein [Azotobacter beijerinckii]SFK43029.1 patatin-related protein [Azotobacter beijerinckii]